MNKPGSHQSNAEGIEKTFLLTPYLGRFGFFATLFAALLVGLVSGVPALLKFPEGIIILPILALLLGAVSRSRLGLFFSGLIIYVVHILVVCFAVTSIGGIDVNTEKFLGRAMIDFFFLGWWFAIIPVSGLGLISRMALSNRKVPMLILPLLLGIIYVISLYYFAKPDISTSYEFVGFINAVNGQGTSTDPLRLTLPVPVVNGTPVKLQNTCRVWGDSYTIPITTERVVESQWGPAWEAEIGGAPERNFLRCTTPSPNYLDIPPLMFVPQNPASGGQKVGVFKLTSNNENVFVNLGLVLDSKGSKKQAISPFLGVYIVWFSYGHEDRMDIKTKPQNDWQTSPILQGPQTFKTDTPYIEILPFG